jgi:hypothetical protein
MGEYQTGRHFQRYIDFGYVLQRLHVKVFVARIPSSNCGADIGIGGGKSHG